MSRYSLTPIWQKTLAILALLFGAITLFKSGSVLFGPQSARDAVGDFVPFVVQFNFVAGFFYVLAGIGIWLGRRWACGLSVLITLATIITAIVFWRHVSAGGMYEMQTVGALAIRTGFWAGIAIVLRRTSL